MFIFKVHAKLLCARENVAYHGLASFKVITWGWDGLEVLGCLRGYLFGFFFNLPFNHVVGGFVL